MAESRASWLSSAMGLFLAWSSLALLGRAWSKLRVRRWGLDDYAMSAAFVSAVIHVAVTYVAIHRGYGLPLADLPPGGAAPVETALYVGQIFYIASIGLCKSSAALFIARLSSNLPQDRPALILAILSLVWTLASIFAAAFRGSAHHPWTVLDGSQAMFSRWIGIEVTGLAIELALWAVSTLLIWNLQMRVKERIMILLIFGTRFLLVPVVVLRLIYLSPQNNDNPTVTSIVPSIMTEAAIHLSIITASLTSLKPFLRSLYPDYAVESSGVSSLGLRSKDHSVSRDAYYKLDTLSTLDKASKNRSVAISRGSFGDSGAENDVARPGAACLRGKDGQSADGGGSESRVTRSHRETEGQQTTPGRMVIHAKTEWSIEYNS